MQVTGSCNLYPRIASAPERDHGTVAALALVSGRTEADPDATAELRRLAGELARRPHVVFGSLLEMTIDRVLSGQPQKEQP